MLSLLVAVSMLFSACAGDNGAGDDGETSAELEAGEITFENGICEVIKGVEDSGTVNVAVASNGAPLTYAVADATEAEKLSTAFGGALTIDADGTIKGVYNEIKNRKIKITASAEKCESVTAEINIKVVAPYLDYTGRQLADAKEGVVYAASVAFVQDEVENVTYSVVGGNGKLPAGLTMDSTGLITGIPTTVGRGVPFSVRAVSSGYSNTEREFKIDVVINHSSEMNARIINFGKEGETTLIQQTAYVGVYYVNQIGVAGKAAALNENNITYALAEGSSLPDGLTLYPNGAIFGKADTRTECTFSVVASAAHCASVTRSFKLEVKPQRIKYQTMSGTLTRTEAAEFDVATADAGEGVAIEYVTDEMGTATLAEYGLSLTSAGKIVGTPTKITARVSVNVTATSEGFTSTTVPIYLTINEPLQAPANGRFEAEYINFDGKNGTGYSSSPSGVDMIDTAPPAGVSVSNGAFVNYMFNDSITLEFVIYAEQAANGVRLYVALGSEIGTTTLTPASFGVYTYEGQDTTGDKTTINYGSATVDGGEHYTSFNEYQLGTVNLVQGWNVIQLAVHNNTLRNGAIGGPAVDYIRLDTNVTLKWIPLKYNVNN